MVRLLTGSRGIIGWGIFTTCVFIGISDIRTRIIPNRYNLLLFLAGILFHIPDKTALESGFVGAGIYPLPLLLLHGYGSDLLGKEAIGFGDIKLTMNLGLILGYRGFWNIYFYYLFSFVSAGIFCVVYLIYERKKKGSAKKKGIPFAPFLILSFMILYSGGAYG